MDMTCNVENMKWQLEQAIQCENTDLAEELTKELLKAQGLKEASAMPVNFVKEIAHKSQRRNAAFKRKRLVIAIAATMILILSIGTIAYAAGFLFPETQNKNGSKTPVNAALDSTEYRAAQEYNQYLDSLTDEERLNVNETSLYDFPQKVKEICAKYNLNYATKQTQFTSFNDLKKELKNRGYFEILPEEWEAKIEETMKDCSAGYYLDDGTVHLEIQTEEERITSLNLAPKGSFPWMGFGSNEGTEYMGKKIAPYILQTKDNITFACIGGTEDMRAFALIGNHYVTVKLGATATDKMFEESEKQWSLIDDLVRKETGLKDFGALNEKISKGYDVALKKAPDPMKKAIKENDEKQIQALVRQFSPASEKEFAVYEKCIREQDQIDIQPRAITEQEIETYLNQLDFSHLQSLQTSAF